MPNPQNTVQVTAQRAGQTYLDTYRLAADVLPPAERVADSFGMTLQELFIADSARTLPAQEPLLRDEDRSRLTLKLAIIEADPRTMRALKRQAKLYEAESIEEYLQDAVLGVLINDEASSIIDRAGSEVCVSLGAPGCTRLKAEPLS
jgi:hypothetical protein